MQREQLKSLHSEIDAAVKEIVERYGLEYLGGTLTQDVNGIRMPIKANRAVTVTTALTADSQTLRAGWARAGTKAIVFDSKETHQHREVIITEVKRKKYGFYFADDPRKRPMIGHFGLFSAIT